MRSLMLVFSSLLLVSLNSAARDWGSHEVAIKSSVVKIREREKKISELIQQKKAASDPEVVGEILKQIVEEHKHLTKDYKDFEEERQHIRFEHPEQGVRVERKYMPFKLKTIEEFEEEGGIDGQLTRLKEKVKDKYGEPEPPKPSPTPYRPKREMTPEQKAKEERRIKLSY